VQCLQGCSGLPDIVTQSIEDVSAALRQLRPFQDDEQFWRRNELQDELLTRFVWCGCFVFVVCPISVWWTGGTCQHLTLSHILQALLYAGSKAAGSEAPGCW
jgi:hypothetical protein